jgi:hypothetical protein
VSLQIVVLVYDYFLTLGSEIERFWIGGFCRGISYGSILFFANRYLALFGYFPKAIVRSIQIETDLSVSDSFECSFLIVKSVLEVYDLSFFVL